MYTHSHTLCVYKYVVQLHESEMFSPRLYYNMGFNKETRNKKKKKEESRPLAIAALNKSMWIQKSQL